MKRQHGLTLIEILVAMSLLSILTVMGYRAFGNLLGAREHIMSTGERWVQLARAFRRVEGDLQRLPREQRPGQSPRLQLAADADGGERLTLAVESQAFPAGQAQLAYRNRQGLWWLAEGEQQPGQGYALLAADWRISWRVLGSDGQWYGQWPVPGADDKLAARALRMQVAVPQDEAVERLWVLP